MTSIVSGNPNGHNYFQWKCEQQKEDQAASLNWVMNGAIACGTPNYHHEAAEH